MNRGKRLMPGDTLGLIAPAGVVRDANAIDRAVQAAQNMGYRVKLGDSARGHDGYLAGTDEERARDVNAMFADAAVDAVVCLRGGYGCMRILDRLDYGMIAAHPKIFMGFSDVTALHIALNQRCDLLTFHGPMAAADWSDGAVDAFTHAHMLRVLTSVQPVGELPNPPDDPRQTVQSGRAQGILTGGNLTLLAASLGTPWEIDTRGKLLFIEEVGEKTYCVDRMLTQLRLAGKFADCAGIVFGDFANCPVEYPAFGLSLEEVIRDVVVPCGKPIFAGLRCGHCTPKLTLPLGAECAMDADKCTLTVLEGAVSE